VLIAVSFCFRFTYQLIISLLTHDKTHMLTPGNTQLQHRKVSTTLYRSFNYQLYQINFNKRVLNFHLNIYQLYRVVRKVKTGLFFASNFVKF